VTLREISRNEVLAALGDGGEDSVLRTCIAVLRAYSRPSYTIGGSPANALRETLEVKYRHAASRGKTLVGDGELLLRLQELGSDPVAVVDQRLTIVKDSRSRASPVGNNSGGLGVPSVCCTPAQEQAEPQMVG
jgi:hypothetical protein